jgi:serine/threonine-protein kinase ATR
MARELLYLCDFPVKRETQLNMPSQFPKLQSLADGNLILPLQSSINVSLPSNHLLSGDHQPFADNLPRITGVFASRAALSSLADSVPGFDPVIDIMPSLQKPRKIVIMGSDGKRYAFLCKPKDDLRKDARLMEFDSMINKLLQADSESRRRRLCESEAPPRRALRSSLSPDIRTYAVVTLNEECGLIEWVPNTIGLRHILSKLYASRGIPLYVRDVLSAA